MNGLNPNPERLERRKFTPHSINLCDWNQVNTLFQELQARSIDGPAELEQFYLDVCDLNSALTEEYCRIQLATSVDTEDATARKRFMHFNEVIMAPVSKLMTDLDNRFLDSQYVNQLDPDRYHQLMRLLKNSRELFKVENIPLQIKDSQLADQFNQIAGGFKLDFRGKKHNLTQMASYQKSTDRDLRKEAWIAAGKCREEKIDQLNDVYDQMISTRTEMARNAGFDNYRDYRHISLNRFDYSPEDCKRFHEMVETQVVSAYSSRLQKRREALGIDTLRPWDLSVDPYGRPPLKPFSTQDELVSGCATILDRIYPKLGDTLRLLKAYGNLDLMTRQNKAPVGFNMPLDETRVSFIFMNSTGYHNDIVVLLHESGHAIETRACINQEIFQYRHTPQEWGECASQSMELLGLEHMDVFYPDLETQQRCVIDKLESILVSLIYTARIDAFQQWVYTHPTATAQDRSDLWVDLSKRFPVGGDFTGFESARQWSWQGIPHLFIVPFYYIEYGIAQMGALQVYQRAKTEGFKALEQWLNTMKQGYSRSIPELYRQAGLSFEFYGDLSSKLIDFLVNEIESIESSRQ